MTNFVAVTLAFGGGLGLGYLYFAGLWLTVRRLPGARRPHLLALASFLLRLGLAFGGFFVIGGGWTRLVAGLLGFVLMRSGLVYRWGLRAPAWGG